MLLTENQTILYHGSTIGGLKTLNPHKSTHDFKYVYATPYIGIAVAYMAKFTDFDISTGTINGVPYIAERYKDALKSLFKKKGYIYTVDPTNFVSSDLVAQNSGFKLRSFEVVSKTPVKVVSIEEVSHPYNYIMSIPKSELVVYTYPNKPNFIPKDDSDLIEKANNLYMKFNDPGIYKELYKKHPKLLKKNSFTLI